MNAPASLDAILTARPQVTVAASRSALDPHWQPYPVDNRFRTDWWNGVCIDDDRLYVTVIDRRLEVARAVLDQRADYFAYAGLPDLPEQVMEILQLEVADDRRGRGWAGGRSHGWFGTCPGGC